MAKFEHPTEDTVKAIDDVFLALIEERYGVRFNVLVNNDQKEVFKVKKYTADIKFAFGYDFQIVINEVILEGLDPVQQNLCIQEELAGVSYDPEKDMVNVKKGDFTSYSGFVEKHTYDKLKTLRESVKSLYDKKKEDDAQNKE
jgi:hypothetical protein